jgi:hypothetical protein
MSIDEQEQVTGRRILGKGGGHQARERIETFAEISGLSVEEHSDGMREAQHLEPPVSVRARATMWMRRQAKRVSVVGMRRRTPLGKSASIASGSLGEYSGMRTVTGRKAGDAAAVG